MKIVTHNAMLENDVFGGCEVATCKNCASQRVIISVNRVDDADDSTESWTVSCGCGGECHHNVSARTLRQAVNAWNKELVDEGLGEEDFATEVVLM